jgi:hypothetical protein
MTTLRTAAQQALEALESLFNWHVDPVRGQRCSDAITALRAALEQPEQEPVAWPQDAHPWLHSTMLVLAADRRPGLRGETPLFTHPPRREWRGLTEDEIYPMYNEPSSDAEMVEFALAIEAALKERNV